MKTRPVVVIALDRAASSLAHEIVGGLSERVLGEDSRYPASMCRAITVLPTKATDSSDRSEDGVAEGPETDLLYASTPRIQFLDRMEEAVDATRDSTEWDALAATHNVEPDPRPLLMLVGCCWTLEMQDHLLKTLDAIHSLPFGRGRSDILGVLLLPELQLSRKADEVTAQRATTFAALRMMQSVIDNPEGHSWEGWFPLDRVWLIGNNDRNGRSLGGFMDVVRALGAGLASYIADGALEEQLRKLGTDEREVKDAFGNSFCYRSFGFREFVFPRGRLREHLFKLLLEESLKGYAGREPELGSDEFVLKARHFLINDIALTQLDRRLTGELTDSKVLSEFSVSDIQAGKVDLFLRRLEEEAHAYAEDSLNRAKRELGMRSRDESETLEAACDVLIEDMIDSVGFRGALRLAQELVGDANEASLEERLPIPEVASRYRQRMVDVVGLVPAPEETGERVEAGIFQIQEMIEACQRELDLLAADPAEDDGIAADFKGEQAKGESSAEGSAPDENQAQQDDTEVPSPEDTSGDTERDDGAEADDSEEDEEHRQEADPDVGTTDERESWREAHAERDRKRKRLRVRRMRLKTLKQRLTRLERVKEQLAKRAAESERFWDDPGTRKKAFARLSQRYRQGVQQTANLLKAEDEGRNELEREKLEIRDRSGKVLLSLFVVVPLCLAGVAVIGSAVAQRLGFSVADQLGFLGRNLEFVIVAIAGYFTLAAWEFLRRVYLPLLRVIRKIREAVEQCRSLRELCVRKWAEMSNSDFAYRVLDRSVQVLQRLTDRIRSRVDTLTQFIARCEEETHSEASFALDRVPGVDVLVSSGDIPAFLTVCFERPIDDEIEEILSGRTDGWSLSSVLSEGDPVDGIQERLSQFFEAKFEARIGRLSVDAILSEYWARLHPPIPPGRRARSIFRLAPFVQLIDLPGESEIDQHYRVSILEGSESRLFQALDAPPHPLTLQPSTSRERISVICESDPFSIASLTKLEVYKEAYERFKRRNKGTELYPKGVKEEELPVLVPSR